MSLELWNKVEKTPLKHTKQVNQRGGFTAINATWQIKQATEIWGTYGSNWGVRNIRWDYITQNNVIIEAIIEAEFYYPDGSFEISSSMLYKSGDDHRKKLLTDLTTKSLSKLGFSADVFMGMYDDNKYIDMLKAEEGIETPKVTPKKEAPKTAPKPAQKKKIETTEQERTLMIWVNEKPEERVQQALDNYELTDDQRKAIESLR